jgi:hypothetical protein
MQSSPPPIQVINDHTGPWGDNSGSGRPILWRLRNSKAE